MYVCMYINVYPTYSMYYWRYCKVGFYQATLFVILPHMYRTYVYVWMYGWMYRTIKLSELFIIVCRHTHQRTEQDIWRDQAHALGYNAHVCIVCMYACNYCMYVIL